MRTHKDPFSARPYRHFDTPLSRVRAERLATDAEQVARHSFFPFLHRTVSTPRYVKRKGKVESKDRHIAYASHSDSVIYAYYGAMLNSRYEELLTEFNLSSIPLAYRTLGDGECNVHFAQRAFDFISEHRPCVAMGFDVKGFFDHIDHSLLRTAWCQILGSDLLPRDHYRVYRSLTTWAWVRENFIKTEFGIDLRRKGTLGKRICSLDDFKNRIRAAKAVEVNPYPYGIPQGSPMSAVLSNIYMLPFDQALQEFVLSCGGLVQRYCDDVLLVVPQEYEEAAYHLVLEAAAERKLAINTEPHKLDKVHFPQTGRVNRPIQYLGLIYDGERTMIRSQTLSRYHRKLRFYLKRARYKAAASPNCKKLYEKKVWKRYSYKGRRNFISYVRRSAAVTGSDSISNQVRLHDKRIKRWIDAFQP